MPYIFRGTKPEDYKLDIGEVPYTLRRWRGMKCPLGFAFLMEAAAELMVNPQPSSMWALLKFRRQLLRTRLLPTRE